MNGITDTYAGRCGEALDQFLNVTVLDGAVGETISYHAATASAGGKRWACWLCRWLSRAVEKDHCKKTLAGVSISERGGLLAGVQLLIVFLALTGLFWRLVLR